MCIHTIPFKDTAHIGRAIARKLLAA
uniref:Uncharacterized protein n=1 Tax=Arundo donax TaxID=35708 RepID=A0A0A8ZVK4_ARUDO